MSQSIVAKRYAQALFELAQQNNKLDAVGGDLKELVKVVQSTPELLELLTAPKISSDRKKSIIAELFANAAEEVVNTLKLLVDTKRIHEVVAVAEDYATLAAEAQGKAQAVVYSTRELSDEERESISQAFAKRVGKESLAITNEIDPSLLGGIRVQIGNHIYDSTVLNKLARLERELIG